VATCRHCVELDLGGIQHRNMAVCVKRKASDAACVCEKMAGHCSMEPVASINEPNLKMEENELTNCYR
jgi:hypothetical protein